MGRAKKPAAKPKTTKKASAPRTPRAPAAAPFFQPITETAKKRKLSMGDEEGIIDAFRTLGLTPPEIKKEQGLRISVQTIHRIMREYFTIERAENEKRAAEERKEGKIQFAIEHSRQNWNDVVFSAVKMFHLDNADTKTDSIHFWGGFTSAGTLKLYFTDKKPSAAWYTEAIQAVLLPFLRRHRFFRYQHSGTNLHESNMAQDCFDANRVDAMDWPRDARNLNPAIDLWQIVARRVYGPSNVRKYASLESLKKAVEREWKALNVTTLKELTDGMPQRLLDILSRR